MCVCVCQFHQLLLLPLMYLLSGVCTCAWTWVLGGKGNDRADGMDWSMNGEAEQEPRRTTPKNAPQQDSCDGGHNRESHCPNHFMSLLVAVGKNKGHARGQHVLAQLQCTALTNCKGHVLP